MTDEGQRGDPMDMVEVLNLVTNAAAMTWRMFDELTGQGFTETQALKLCAAYLHGTAGGKLDAA